MEFPLFEAVILLVDLPEEGLAAGDVGTVVERHDVSGLETGYSVADFDTYVRSAASTQITPYSLLPSFRRRS